MRQSPTSGMAAHSSSFTCATDGKFVNIIKETGNIQYEYKTAGRANLREVLFQVSEHHLNLWTLLAVGCELLLQLSLAIDLTPFVEAIVNTVVHSISFAIVFVVRVFGTNRFVVARELF